MATKPENPSPIFDLPIFIPENWINTTTATTTTTSVENTNIIGEIVAYQGTSLPSANWLWCDGTTYDTTLYSDLFDVIGYNYGGSGSNFSVPNLCSRTPLGADATNIYTTTYQGTPTTSSGNRNMSVNQLGQHNHAINSVAPTGMLQNLNQNNAIQTIGQSPNTGEDVIKSGIGVEVAYTATAGNAGNSADLLPPFSVSNFIIRAIVVL
jgi:microcystin-dependent protein